jgi:hypothetical protein
MLNGASREYGGGEEKLMNPERWTNPDNLVAWTIY